MAKLTEVEFLEKIADSLKEAHKESEVHQIRKYIYHVIHFIQGRIDTLPE